MTSAKYSTIERMEWGMFPTLYLQSEVISVLKATLALVPCEASFYPPQFLTLEVL